MSSAFEDHWEMIHRPPVEGEREQTFKVDGQEVKVTFFWEIKRDPVIDEDDYIRPSNPRHFRPVVNKDWIAVSPWKVCINDVKSEGYLDDDRHYDLIVEMAREIVQHHLG